MRSFFHTVNSILESFGRARAAAYLSRQGQVDQAKALLLAD